MKRTDLEHIIRAAGSIVEDNEIIVERLVPIQNDNTRGIIGWCLEIHDLLASKDVAGRERDLEFSTEAIKHGLIFKDLLDERIKLLPLNQTLKERFLRKIAAEFLDLDDTNTS